MAARTRTHPGPRTGGAVPTRSVPELLEARAPTSPRHRDAYRDVTTRLRLLVADLAAQGESRLPSEEQLSIDTGVSRATLRSGLLALEHEGRVQRVHGRGTFINRHAVAIQANLAEDRAFVDLLRDVGHVPTVTSEVRAPGPLQPALCGLLGWSSPRDVCTVARVHRASGRPAVFLRDHVPVELLTTPAGEVTAEESTFGLLRAHTGRQVRYSVAEVVPVLADAEVAGRLEVAGGHPLLLLLHTHLDEDDEALAVTEAYVDDRYLKFSVVRTYRDA